jgi:DNA-binding NtrC family response regulator
METYDWPGNVRELQNRVTRAVLMSEGQDVTPAGLGLSSETDPAARTPLERREIEIALLNASGSVSCAAASLGISRQALYRRMEKLGIVLERKPRA